MLFRSPSMRRPRLTACSLIIACAAVLSAGTYLFDCARPTVNIAAPAIENFLNNSSPAVQAQLSPQFGDTVLSAQNSGKPRAAAPAQQVVGANIHATIMIGMMLRHTQILDRVLYRQANPHSPEYRHYLSTAQFVKHFGPSQWAINQMVKELNSSGLTVLSISANRLTIEASGTIGKLEQLAVPKYLANQVATVAVTGVDLGAQSQAAPGPAHGPTPTSGPTPAPASAAKAQHLPPIYGPEAIATAYDFPNQNNKRASNTEKLTGKGTTIAILMFADFHLSDAETFWKTAHIKRTGSVTKVYLGKNPGVSSASVETDLDVEQAGAQAPGADLIVYVSHSRMRGATDFMFNQAVSDNKADIISSSIGGCEYDSHALHLLSFEHEIWEEAHAQGMAVFDAAGDTGAYDCPLHGKLSLSIDDPSSDPYVTAVGGTTLTLNKYGRRVSEKAWSDGGGGVSWYFARPYWQVGSGLPVHGVDATRRNTPDLALNSKPNYPLYKNGNWYIVGGTSAAAPNMSALWALVDQAAGYRVGDVNEELYRIGSSPLYHQVFYDVTTGNNGWLKQVSDGFFSWFEDAGPGYKAYPGWDHTTGWGAPNGTALVKFIISEAPILQHHGSTAGG